MNMDSYDALLSDVDCIKEQLFAMSKHINVIENTVNLILMAVGDKERTHKEEKIPMKKLVDVLPNDRLLDEFEHTEGTYKDYSKISNDQLTETEIKSFEAGQRGEIYSPEQEQSTTFAEAVEQTVARRKGSWATASEHWPTDEELDAQEEAELTAYKKHLESDKEYGNCEVL